jgi:outer membrane protein assembly factor BamB
MLARTALIIGLVTLVGGNASGSPGAAPMCREGAIVSAKTGKVLQRFSARGGDPHGRAPLLPGPDVVSDGHGGWYLSGIGLAHLLPSGQLDRGWRSGLQGRLEHGTLQRVGNRLYVSDWLHVIALDATTGARLWTSPAIGGAHILAVAANESTVYVGGRFSRLGTAHRQNLAALDAKTGRVLPWRGPAITYPNVTSFVTTLALAPRRLYLGGWFTRVGGKPRPSGVAALRLDAGGVTTFAPRFSADDVSSIATAGRTVLIGGTFGGGTFDAGTSKPVRGFAGVPGASTISVHGSTAYLGGNIRSSISAHNLLAVDLRSHRLTRWRPNLAPYVIVQRLAVSGAKVFVGGSFCSSIG